MAEIQLTTQANAIQPEPTVVSTAPTTDTGSAISIDGTASATPIAPVPPATTGQVEPYLTQVQNQEYQTQTNAELSKLGLSAESQQALSQTTALTDTLMGGKTAPTAPSLTETFKNLSNEYGVKGLSDQISELKKYEQDTFARLRQRKMFEEGKAVAGNVIAGRVGEVQKQEQENLDYIQRQISFRTDQLNSAYGVINQMMQLTQQDFQNASQQYEQEFNQKMSMYQQLRGEAIQEKDYARANLEVYMNMIQKGSMNYKKLDASTKAEIAKMEVQSGLGLGFMSKLKIAPSESIKSITDRIDSAGRKYADIITIDQNGAIKVKTKYVGMVGLGSSGGGGGGYRSSGKLTSSQLSAQQKQQLASAQASMTTQLRSVSGGDGYVSPDSYKEAKKAWVARGYTADQFDNMYNGYVNPDHWGDYGSYGTLSKYFS